MNQQNRFRKFWIPSGIYQYSSGKAKQRKEKKEGKDPKYGCRLAREICQVCQISAARVQEAVQSTKRTGTQHRLQVVRDQGKNSEDLMSVLHAGANYAGKIKTDALHQPT